MLNLLGRFLVPGALLAFSILFFLNIRDLPPEASLLPELMIVVLLALTLSDLVSEGVAWSRLPNVERRTDWRAAWDSFVRNGLRTSVIIVLTFLWLFFGVANLGFFESTAIFIPLGLLALGERRIGLIVPLTVASVALCYVVFSLALNLRLPHGLLF